MVALNGPLIALLCAAYFVLVVCALSYDQSPLHRDARCSRRDTDVANPAAYALTTMERDARSPRLDETISAVVLGLRNDSGNQPVEHRRAERCTRGRRAQNRPRALSKSG